MSMIEKNIGFIGMGNMASAIASGFIRNSVADGNKIYAYAPNQDKLNTNAKNIGFTAKETVIDLLKSVEIILMACKPYQIDSVLDEIGDFLYGKSIISIALGWDHARYIEAFKKRNIDCDKVKVQFVMPNTPAQVGEGVFLFEQTHNLEDTERMQMMDAFGRLGLVRELPSSLMGIGGAITGCGPAFVDLYIEAMADAAVKYGIPRAMSYELVSQTVLGSAKLQLETGTHPAILKDAVCSPAGSTIRGVTSLENDGFRAACQGAIEACMNK